jgi:hypothetical protein
VVLSKTSFPVAQQTPRVGLEPTCANRQSAENKELTEKANPVLSTGLDKIVQEYPDLEQIITTWPELPEETKTAIKKLIETHSRESE